MFVISIQPSLSVFKINPMEEIKVNRKYFKFTKSLKFKLTMWYSLILSVFCISFLITVNVLVTQYMGKWEPEQGTTLFFIDRTDSPWLNSLSEEQTDLIMDARQNDLENIRELSIYAVIPLILLSFVGGYILSSILLKPLEKLNSEIKKKEMENINEEIPFDDNGDEISELIKSFNRMSNRLGKSFENQKQFVENASHELKTPLSLIQANIDTAMDDGTISKEELNDLLLSSKKQIKFMNDLTEDLLLMTLKDDIKFERVDIVSLIRKMIDSVKRKDFLIKLNVNLKGKDIVFVEGNDVLLERALMNIVENSIKYSGGNELDINIDKKHNELIIRMKDNGKGIPDESKEKIFDRFYRVDKGRSRKEGGSGLGLSITKKIIECHNGKVYLNTENKEGAEFVVVMKILKNPKV